MKATKCAYCGEKFDQTASVEWMEGILHKVGGKKDRLVLCPEHTALLMSLVSDDKTDTARDASGNEEFLRNMGLLK